MSRLEELKLSTVSEFAGSVVRDVVNGGFVDLATPDNETLTVVVGDLHFDGDSTSFALSISDGTDTRNFDLAVSVHE